MTGTVTTAVGAVVLLWTVGITALVVALADVVREVRGRGAVLAPASGPNITVTPARMRRRADGCHHTYGDTPLSHRAASLHTDTLAGQGGRRRAPALRICPLTQAGPR